MSIRRVCMIALVAFAPVCAFAQIVPPAPGVEIPQAYYDRIAENPRAFRFEKAWIQKAERAREYRRQLAMQRGPDFNLASLPEALRERAAVAGTISVPVILVKYANTPSEPQTVTQWQDHLFDNPSGTITEMYDEMSYGLITLTGTVYGWTALPQNDTYYEGPFGCNGLCGSAHTGALLLSALQANDAAIDFGQYDNDGPDGVPNSGDDDGFVDFVSFVHPELGGECGTSNMWSHRFVVGGWPEFGGLPWTTNDARTGGGFIKVWDYTIQPALGGASGCSAGQNAIGVFCHEFGHAFGLPDLYDTNGGGEGAGEHALMGAGNWQNPDNPAHMGAWEKVELGWVSPIDVGPALQPYTVHSVEVNPEIYRLDIVEEPFRRKTFNPLAGTASLHCGLTNAEASQRNWVGSGGYGNGWNEEIHRTFTYNGANPVTLQYDISYDTEATYDFARAKIEVNGTKTVLASYDGTGSATGVSINITPYLNGSGASEYRIIFQLQSDLSWSDEDGSYNSGTTGPLKVDNVSVTGGGEAYSGDFEVNSDGWCQDLLNDPPREYFLVENRNKGGGAIYDQNLHGQGLFIWHIEEAVAHSSLVNDGRPGNDASTSNLLPLGVKLMEADNANHLILGTNRGDGGDMFPGTSNNTTFDNASSPNSMSYNNAATQVVVQNISAPSVSMTANMRAGRVPPTATIIQPNNGTYNQVVSITRLGGTQLYEGGTFCLRGLFDYPATNVRWVSKGTITGDLDLTGVLIGVYDVVYKGPDGQEAVLADGFTVNPATASGIGDAPVLVNRLDQNHPNPFNPSTTISYSIKQRGRVTLRVYNAAGQLIRTLVNDDQVPREGGFHVIWDGRSDAGSLVASGVYLYKLTAGDGFESVKKLLLLK